MMDRENNNEKCVCGHEPKDHDSCKGVCLIKIPHNFTYSGFEVICNCLEYMPEEKTITTKNNTNDYECPICSHGLIKDHIFHYSTKEIMCVERNCECFVPYHRIREGGNT